MNHLNQQLTICSRDNCSRHIINIAPHRLSQPFFTEHCSLYCWKASTEIEKSGTPSESTKKNPTLLHNCESCGGSFELHYSNQWANQIFCSKTCQHKTYRGNRVKQSIKILQFLKNKYLINPEDTSGWTSEEIAFHINRAHPSLTLTVGGTSQKIKRYIARQIIIDVDAENSRPKKYRFNPLASNTPLASLLNGKI